MVRIKDTDSFQFIKTYNNFLFKNGNNSIKNQIFRNSRVISFNQGPDLIRQLDLNEHKTLLGFVHKYGGLCELVCNRILIDDLLGKEADINLLKNRVNVLRLNETKIKKSHLLNVYSTFNKFRAYLFGIYPDNIFSYSDQWKLVNKKLLGNKKIYVVNRKILGQGLENILEGETLKLEVFMRNGFALSGHSLLIKKLRDDTYIFFDPNTGEHRKLSFDQLCDAIDNQLKLQNGTDIFLVRGKDYLKRVEKKIGPLNSIS